MRQSEKIAGIRTLAESASQNFNTIMATILANSYVIEWEARDSEKFSRSITAIRGAVRRWAGLVQDLCTFVQGPLSQPREIDMNEVLASLVHTLGDELPDSISLNIHVSDNLPDVLGDRQQLLRALMHLGANARDAMPDGGVLSVLASVVPGEEVRSRLPGAHADGYLYVAIVDNGEGMDDTTRQRIFDPFYTTKDPGQATGLGLAVVHGVVQNHNGFITVGSQLAMGTMVCVYLPAHDANTAR